MFNSWQPVPILTTWNEFTPGAILLYTDDDAVVADARTKDGKIKLRLQRLDGERFERDVDRDSSIKKEARKLLGDADDIRAMALPAVIWREDRLFSVRNMAALLATALVTSIVLMLSSNGGLFYAAVMAGGAAGVFVRRQFKRGNELTILAPDRLGITMETVLPYALTREQGKLWVPPTLGGDRRQLAFSRVDAIRDSYLALREDVAYRIENPALFDPAVPATAEFEAALVAFEDVNDSTRTIDVDALASEVEVTFNVAQANAERLGLMHLPEHARSDARRAGKAARLAAGATTEGEREASLTQVKRILDSLALYYLPTLDETLAIEAPPAPVRVSAGQSERDEQREDDAVEEERDEVVPDQGKPYLR